MSKTNRKGRRIPGPADAVSGGLTLVVSVLLFLAVGAWADSKAGTAPVLSLVGAFLGAGAGIYSLCRRAVTPKGRRSDHR